MALRAGADRSVPQREGARVLSPVAVKDFYDHFGARQDQQGFYEDAALATMRSHGAFPVATSIVEFGCGTGRLAEALIAEAPIARYIGFDVSTTMRRLAMDRLAHAADRASVQLLPPGTVTLPLADRSADRLVTTYVLDLLPVAAIAGVLAEARRVLVPQGRLCAVSLTHGRGPLSGAVSAIWTALFRLRPSLVGGCRPIALEPSARAAGWHIEFREVVTRWGITSEVLVARPTRTDAEL